MTLDEYNKLKASGMMWELHPEFTGAYDVDVPKSKDSATMKNYIAKWKTYEFVQSPLCGYPQRETKQRGQVVYAKSAIQVVDMIRHIDPNARYIEVDEYKETE